MLVLVDADASGGCVLCVVPRGGCSGCVAGRWKQSRMFGPSLNNKGEEGRSQIAQTHAEKGWKGSWRTQGARRRNVQVQGCNAGRMQDARMQDAVQDAGCQDAGC